MDKVLNDLEIGYLDQDELLNDIKIQIELVRKTVFTLRRVYYKLMEKKNTTKLLKLESYIKEKCKYINTLKDLYIFLSELK
jgi:hypothetical protein